MGFNMAFTNDGIRTWSMLVVNIGEVGGHTTIFLTLDPMYTIVVSLSEAATIITRVLQDTYPVRTKHWLYCSDIVAYACVIVESHSQYTRHKIRMVICATTHLLTCVHVGAVIILWQHCWGPSRPPGPCCVIWRLIDAIDGIFGDINLKSKHYTGFCDEPARYKTDVFFFGHALSHIHINIHMDANGTTAANQRVWCAVKALKKIFRGQGGLHVLFGKAWIALSVQLAGRSKPHWKRLNLKSNQ